MRKFELFEVWKGYNIYHCRLSGLFSTAKGHESYVLNECRACAVKGW